MTDWPENREEHIVVDSEVLSEEETERVRRENQRLADEQGVPVSDVEHISDEDLDKLIQRCGKNLERNAGVDKPRHPFIHRVCKCGDEHRCTSVEDEDE